MFGNPLEMTPVTGTRRNADLRTYSRWEYGDENYGWIVRSVVRTRRAPLWPRMRRRAQVWLASLRAPVAIPAQGSDD